MICTVSYENSRYLFGVCTIMVRKWNVIEIFHPINSCTIFLILGTNFKVGVS